MRKTSQKKSKKFAPPLIADTTPKRKFRGIYTINGHSRTFQEINRRGTNPQTVDNPRVAQPSQYGATVNAVVTRDLERFYLLLDSGRDALLRAFNSSELNKLYGFFKDAEWTVETLPRLLDSPAFSSHHPQLAKRLCTLNTLSLLALFDAIEIYKLDPEAHTHFSDSLFALHR